jgi:crossover junction endodeoxyribonuclease RusA
MKKSHSFTLVIKTSMSRNDAWLAAQAAFAGRVPNNCELILRKTAPRLITTDSTPPVEKLANPPASSMRSITLILPIPAREVSPNARRGESRIAAIRKSKFVKKHRLWAKNAMMIPIMRGEVGNWIPVGYSLKHFFETVRVRDDDNADGACKAYRDGICDALGINDKALKKIRLSEISKDAERPRTEFTIYFQPPAHAIHYGPAISSNDEA